MHMSRRTLTRRPTLKTSLQHQLLRTRRRRDRRRGRLKPRVKDGMPRPLWPEPRTMVESRAGAAKTPPSPPSPMIIALTRLGFGPSPQAMADFQALGATDAQRYQAYINQQLAPSTIDDSAAVTRLAACGFQTLGKTVPQLWADHFLAEEWDDIMQPLWESVGATWVRAIHSKRQLFELMVDFWHNHFNVFADDVPFGPVWVHTDRDAIRAHALGNFRQMVEAVTRTPAMLFYLDNVFNSQEDANENFARELLELHVMGADSYLGSVDPATVPTDGNGVPVGYTEADVIEVARCLTGWTVNSQWAHWEFGETGEFFFHEDWHDTGAKRVIGLDLPAGRTAAQDGQAMLDWVCAHPATARFVATKICRRVMADNPPQAVIDAAAATFLAQVDAPDQIAQVLRTILEHPSFLQTWGDKVKRPFEIAVSMFRGATFDLPFSLGDEFSGWFLWEYYQTGQPLFSWHPPNGYPDSKFAWNTTSPRVMTWRLANLLVTMWSEDAESGFIFDLAGRTPTGVRSANQIVDHWSLEILGRPLPPGERGPLVSFMAQDAHPDTPLEIGNYDAHWETHERLHALVALILMCPSFLWK